jgi:tRNA nucleotidyltransferase (CCA-adding enzyme)
MATSTSTSIPIPTPTADSPITATGVISLTETEERFVCLLDEFARGYETPIECRIAGGWVRDKVSEDHQLL